jgi:hypothetical protein
VLRRKSHSEQRSPVAERGRELDGNLEIEDTVTQHRIKNDSFDVLAQLPPYAHLKQGKTPYCAPNYRLIFHYGYPALQNGTPAICLVPLGVAEDAGRDSGTQIEYKLGGPIVRCLCTI